MPVSVKAGRGRRGLWFHLAWMIPAAVVLLLLLVIAARALRELAPIQSFLSEYPGFSALPTGAPSGFPAWLGWQHFLNSFLIVLIIRSGWLIHTGDAALGRFTWTSRSALWHRLARTREPLRMGLGVWWHVSLDVLWLLNGVIFYIVLFASGQWVRIVPVTWEVLPNAVSAALQYLSMDWPLESGWTNYNSLQVMTYFVTVFIAAPLAVAAGVRMLPGLSTRFGRFGSIFSLHIARKLHVAVMIWFVAFIAIHVTLVFATGTLRNLNHMYAGRDDESWVGFWIFAASLVAIIVGWFCATPTVIRYLATGSGSVSR